MEAPTLSRSPCRSPMERIPDCGWAAIEHVQAPAAAISTPTHAIRVSFIRCSTSNGLTAAGEEFTVSATGPLLGMVLPRDGQQKNARGGRIAILPPLARSTTVLPPLQLRDLQQVAAGVFHLGDNGSRHVRGRHGEFRARGLHPLVIRVQIVRKEHGCGLALLV